MESSSELFELASVSLACRDRETLLKTFAARAGGILGARAVLVWLYEPAAEGLECQARWTEPGEKWNLSDNGDGQGILTEVFETRKNRRLGSNEWEDGDFAHLENSARGRVKTAMLVGLPGAQGLAGVVEALNKRTGEFTAEDERFLDEASRLAGQALTHLDEIEGERQTQLATLERLTALYDLGRTLTSTLELAPLLPIIAGKIRDILGAGACNLWLVDRNAGELYLASQAGEDPTVAEDARASAEEGLLGEVLQQANPRLIDDAATDGALAGRREAGGEFAMRSYMAAPLRKDDEVLGVVELVNKNDGSPFDEDDLFFLSSISEQAAVAIHNANLLESERKVHALDALLKISKEITATLDLDHVLTTVVAQASEVVPFDRCVIGFYDRGKFLLGALSGETEVPKTLEMSELRDCLEWIADQEGGVSADLFEDGWHLTPEDARSQVVPFLEAHQSNGFYALPLKDDQGTLGVLAMLSGDADFLTDNNKETVAILANQTTVAIRNAQLYQQVPLANFLAPLAEKKKRLLSAMPQTKWRMYAERALWVAIALFVIPWPLRLGTDATVVPADRRIVSAVEGGVVRRVFVHEGQSVTPGEMLAQLDDGDDRVKLAQAQADLALARRDLAEAEFRNDPTAAGQARIRTDLHQAEVDLDEDRIAEAQLRSPIAGVITTPKVEEKAGILLRPGDAFCEIVQRNPMAAEMSVEESDLGLVRQNKQVALKLNAFPTETFEGTVERIGAQTHSQSGDQYFLVRAIFKNTEGLARTGMVGRGRIRAGGGWFQSEWYPIGYVLLRSPARWLWQELWVLLP